MTTRKTRQRHGGSHPHSSLSTPMQYDNISYGAQQYQQHAYNFQPSDYESDNAYISAAEQQPPTVVPPAQTRSPEEINLTVLQRYNPAITNILSKASYAVVYTFNPSTSAWEKSGVEGTLFVCQLLPVQLGEARYNAIILNRRSLDNFEAQLLDDDDVEITDDYIILNVRDEGVQAEEAQKVYGLWIFCEPPPSSTAEARLDNANKIKECAAYAAQTRKQAETYFQQQNQYLDGAAESSHPDVLLNLFRGAGLGPR